MSMKHAILRILMIPVRLVRGWKYPAKKVIQYIQWVFNSREHTNLTYHLDPLNVRYMGSLLAEVTGQSREQITSYMDELENDEGLRLHIKKLVRSSDRAYLADEEPRYARRAGWYALIRALKPAVVVETGVDKGLGACVITAALRKNAEEGVEGYYYGTDINPKAGYFLRDPYSQYGEILYGDSIDSLSKLDCQIDLFINDSDHSKDYELREYDLVRNKLGNGAVIIGDNSHGSPSLYDFSQAAGRKFLFFQEKPINHWYPGGGMGISF